MELIVTIVRHGNTFAEGEPVRRIGSRTDLPLVASGIDQAHALGDHFVGQGLAFTRALVGPLARARDTMALILARQPNPPAIEQADWLTEIDHGSDEGLAESAVTARIGEAALAMWDRSAVAPDGWIVDEARRLQAWRDLWGTGAGHILIVTSNGAARFALHADDRLKAQAASLASLKLRTGAYGVIARQEGALALVAWDVRP